MSPAVCLLLFPALVAAQEPETVGAIEGAAVEVKGPAAVTQRSSGKATSLFSGSEITVREGHARITLTGGGEIDICGPASFSVLKSGGALTLALNYGRIHARIAPEGPLVVYSPLVVATLVSIGNGPRVAVLGLSGDGAMCVLAAHGAVRLEHQFSGHRTLVPQYGEMAFENGQLDMIRAAEGGCRCDIPADKPEPVLRAEMPPTKPVERKEETLKAAESNVTFTAVMPPLTFDARRPANPPEPRPEVLILLREVRVQPTAVFTGRIEPRVKPAAPAQASAGAASGQKPGFGAKFKNFFRRLFGGKPR